MLKLISTIMTRLQRDEKGASAVEYAVLVGAVGLAVAAAVTSYKGALTTAFGNIITAAGL